MSVCTYILLYNKCTGRLDNGTCRALSLGITFKSFWLDSESPSMVQFYLREKGILHAGTGGI